MGTASNPSAEAAASLLLSLAEAYGKRPSTAPLEKVLRESKDPRERQAALGQLLSHHYDRSDALRALEIGLQDPDPRVRVRAAQLLFTLGSPIGRETLFAVMRSAIPEDTETLSDAVAAATVLTRFREAIPADILLQLYDRHPHPGLLSTMATQGDPRYFPFLAEALDEERIAGNVLNLGVLGAPEGYAAAKQIFDSTQNPQTKVAAAWTMFRTGGDRAALEFVLEHASLDTSAPKPVELTVSMSIQDARRALYVTKDETVRDVLRKAVVAPASDISSSSLASLLYVQQDLEFVDAVVRKFLSDRTAYPAIDHNLVWRIAAIRNDPEVVATARAQFPDAYEYHFVRTKGRPPEGWIWSYLSDLPMQ